MLCATTRRTPAASAASIRWRVPVTRISELARRFPPFRSVSWCITTSGAASATARRTPSASNTSPRTALAPRLRSQSASASRRTNPVTECPRPTSNGTSRRPITPVAPARKTRITNSDQPEPSGRQCFALPHAAVFHDVAAVAAPLHLAALELLVIERRVQPALPEQVPVRPRLHDPSAVDDVDHVGVDDSGQPVRDRDRGPRPHQRVERLLHLPLAGRVQRRRRLVQDQDARVV